MRDHSADVATLYDRSYKVKGGIGDEFGYIEIHWLLKKRVTYAPNAVVQYSNQVSFLVECFLPFLHP